ncbi:3-oxoacyl-ACP reductase FabG [Streptomyces sp. NPDC086091]|uniref:3-oxoacyl-ACP reductase FabG n=1 Tax=Streptomyces sp. NPDC086091 TaxID=3365751 RepID=UPI0037FA281F
MHSTEQARPVALVTGGTRGIGRAVVLRLVRDGYDVAFCHRAGADTARTLEKEASELGGRAVGTRADVVDLPAVQEWVAATEEELGPLRVVVTSAGIVRDRPLATMEDADWHDVVDVNLTGTYNVCRAAVFPMMKRRSGAVVNVSSVSGVLGNATQTNYAATKAGIIGFSRSLAKEVGRFGIRVNAIAPGFIETEMLAGMPEKARRDVLSQVTLGRFGTVEEVADGVSYLVGASYVTGSVLRVDGGVVG